MKKIIEYFKKNKWQLLISLILSIIFTSVYMEHESAKLNKIERITYIEYLSLLNDNKIDQVYYNEDNEWMTIALYNKDTKDMSYEDRLEYKDYENSDKRLVLYPGKAFSRADLFKRNVIATIVKPKPTVIETIVDVIGLVFPIFWIIILLSLLKSSMSGSLMGNDKKSLVKTSDKKFENIIGHEEILDDIKFITKLLSNPEIGEEMGAKVPKGILLSGDPGCGKTLIGKAIAGEANVPFIYASASGFVDRFVGMGAKNVRDIFKEARKNAPCVVFIDEIDAIGNRSSAGGNTETTQTINALLEELDGFSGRDGIFVIAATNFPEKLDEALTRSGRFDRQIVVSKPRTWQERKMLFDYYIKEIKTDNSVDIDYLSKMTYGFTGADIAAVCNEAAVIAVMQDKEIVDTACVEEAIDKKIFNGNRSKKEKLNKDKQIIAYHESGHAVAHFLLGSPISKASIQSTVSGIGGYVGGVDKTDTVFETKKDFENDIMICCAGRVSEAIKFGEDNITFGASNDIEQATAKADLYNNRLGFNKEIGFINISDMASKGYINQEKTFKANKTLIDTLYSKTETMLNDNYDLVEALAQKLIEVESMMGEDIEELLNNTINNRSVGVSSTESENTDIVED